jgi:hypothetical protein
MKGPDNGMSEHDEPKRYCLPKQEVRIFEAKPNKMSTEAHRQLVRFLRYTEPLRCGECNRKGKAFWTMLCSFQAWDLGMLVPTKSGKVHQPLTPVCQKHLLAAEMDEVNEHSKRIHANSQTPKA